jgi:hypothetical protein
MTIKVDLTDRRLPRPIRPTEPLTLDGNPNRLALGDHRLLLRTAAVVTQVR